MSACYNNDILLFLFFLHDVFVIYKSYALFLGGVFLIQKIEAYIAEFHL